MLSRYGYLTQEELVALLERRDATEEKFGLVWERDEVGHEKALNSDFVVLDAEPSLSVGTAPFHNLLIEGHNFDALRYLLMTFAGRVSTAG
jgi:adenine-specific DNA-methyltransferase